MPLPQHSRDRQGFEARQPYPRAGKPLWLRERLHCDRRWAGWPTLGQPSRASVAGQGRGAQA
eukprot:1682828-Pyramimonas_sp.AAC.1